MSQLIKGKGVISGGLKSYCKTRWITASESVNSVINLQQILEEIVTNNRHLFSNDNIISDIQILAFVLEPLRKAVLALEARVATLADCFLSLIRLAAMLNKLSRSFNPSFRNHCVKIINERLMSSMIINISPVFSGFPFQKCGTKKNFFQKNNKMCCFDR